MSENISEIDYTEVIEYALDPLIVHSQLKIIYINRAAEEFFKASKEEIIGASPLDIFKDTSKPSIEERISGAYSRPAEVIEETIYKMDGTAVDVELYCHPVKIGDTEAIQTYVRDISNRKHQERIENEMKKQINELSSTIVPLMDGIAVLPLMGSINEDQVAALLERVPEKVRVQEVEKLIIDFSGIYQIDNTVVDYLFRINNVLKLLGVECVLTGLRPQLASEAIEQNINVSDITTISTVKAALNLLGVNHSL
ncbi:PAS domain S-box protein [Sediminibacillus massiliensis]|uniref:PAS domain S-box protein n=1 Tax=Sediminibacillus massiliensis TaxID=1926277 RepID=UPI000988366F|nr:PAS domain S-box protein [Sediminibacillus massiliensis]